MVLKVSKNEAADVDTIFNFGKTNLMRKSMDFKDAKFPDFWVRVIHGEKCLL